MRDQLLGVSMAVVQVIDMAIIFVTRHIQGRPIYTSAPDIPPVLFNESNSLTNT